MTVSKRDKVVSIRATDETASTKNGDCEQSAFLSEDRHKLDYQVLHQSPGRMRLRVHNLRYDSQRASACILQIAGMKGILHVRTNYWCASTVIEYDPAFISPELILSSLAQLDYDSNGLIAPDQRKHSENLFVRLLRKVLTILDHSLPAHLQLGFGIGAFAASLLEFPVFATKTLLALSVAPIASRALHTMLDEHKVGVDALDGMAAGLMAASGRSRSRLHDNVDCGRRIYSRKNSPQMRKDSQ